MYDVCEGGCGYGMVAGVVAVWNDFIIILIVIVCITFVEPKNKVLIKIPVCAIALFAYRFVCMDRAR